MLHILLLLASIANAGVVSGGAPPILGSGASVTYSSITIVGALTVSSTSASFYSAVPVTISSAAFIGVVVSSQAVGGAGSAVTATCRSPGLFAIGGGCSCSGAVAETSNVSQPNCQTSGCVPTGWTCQVAGGTGGACIAYAVCSRAQ